MKKFFLLSFTSLLLTGAVYSPLEAMEDQEPSLTPAPSVVAVQVRDLSQDGLRAAPAAGGVATPPAPRQKPYLDVLQEELTAALLRRGNFDPELEIPYMTDLGAGKKLRALSFLHINQALSESITPVLLPLIVSYLSTLGNDVYFFARKMELREGGIFFLPPFDSLHRYAAELGCVDAGMGLAVEALALEPYAPPPQSGMMLPTIST